jgi:hypothetical protein
MKWKGWGYVACIMAGIALCAICGWFIVVLPGSDNVKQLKSDLTLASEQLAVSNLAATASAAAATRAGSDAADAKRSALDAAARAASAESDARASHTAFDSLLADNLRLVDQLGQAATAGKSIVDVSIQLATDSSRAKLIYSQWASSRK